MSLRNWSERQRRQSNWLSGTVSVALWLRTAIAVLGTAGRAALMPEVVPDYDPNAPGRRESQPCRQRSARSTPLLVTSCSCIDRPRRPS